MVDTANEKNGKNIIIRLISALRSPSTKFSLGLLLICGFVGGVLFWGSYNWAMAVSNTEEFCISCHEMEATVYQELKETVHYSNTSGVRAICSDCHVPKEWYYKFVRKIKATNELYHSFLGTVNTPEKFEKKRLHMANNVWTEMKETDSRECRNCHTSTSMALEDQSRPARKKHKKAMKEGLTCIECHQGIAHKLPKDWKKSWKKK